MKGYTGKTIWFTGLPSSGKSTLSTALEDVLQSREVPVVVLDGDVLRHGLNRDLGFSAIDRAENIRRAAEVAKILSDAGHTVLAAFITPLESLRRAVRGLFEPSHFAEIFVDCPLDVCETRDPKGHYRRARRGEIPEFTGVSSPFESPSASELRVATGEMSLEESLAFLLGFLEERFPDLKRVLPTSVRAPQRRRKLAVLGLDSVPPALVFDNPGKDLHNLRALMDHGVWGALRSTDPPVTVPAWTTITTGKDPGELGLYGFRNRIDRNYDSLVTVNSAHVEVPRVWDYLERTGKSSILMGIPQTYPTRPHRGITVSDFVTLQSGLECTYPAQLASELSALAGGEYMPDVKDFRTDDKARLLKDLYLMAERRFRVATKLLLGQSWDFFMMVEIAPDRLHHGFWRYAAQDHRLYQPGNPYENAISDFYRYLDSRIGSILALLDDDTTVMVLSDHGVRTIKGGVCINEWLIRNGFLVLREQTDGQGPITPDIIDWSKTTAWGEGGYYARIFLNVKGREPQGTVDPGEYQSLRQRLAESIAAIPGENNEPMATTVLMPEEIYRACRNVPPDLIVYFDNLSRRSIGTIGHGEILQAGNDTGPDDANHDLDGILICTRMADLRRGKKKGRRIDTAHCMDITPTILHEFGLAVPEGVGGTIIALDDSDDPRIAGCERANAAPADAQPVREAPSRGFTSEEEELVKKRLMDLGYL